jgi:uncharacterized protein DUF4279
MSRSAKVSRPRRVLSCHSELVEESLLFHNHARICYVYSVEQDGMESPPPLMSVYFVVTGMRFDPHERTGHFGIEPTEVLIKGDVRLGKRPPVPKAEWVLKTKRQGFYTTDEPLQLLLNMIWPKRRRIMACVTRNKLKVTFVLWITGTTGRNLFYCVSADSIKRLGYFKAPLHMDVY